MRRGCRWCTFARFLADRRSRCDDSRSRRARCPLLRGVVGSRYRRTASTLRMRVLAQETTSGFAIWTAQPRQLAGSGNARALFWSPDSAFVGFFSGFQLKKVAVGGGAVVTICTVPEEVEEKWSGAWSPD